jgi:hypothetical protein
MKRLLSVLAVLCVCGTAFAAGVPPDTELTLAASGGKVLDKTVWNATGELLVPLGSGVVMLGPSVVLSSADELNRVGAALEFNLTGVNGLFLGGAAHWYLKSLDGECVTSEAGTLCDDDPDRHTVALRAGFKLPIGQGALAKIYAEQAIDGRLADSTDMTINIALGARF